MAAQLYRLVNYTQTWFDDLRRKYERHVANPEIELYMNLVVALQCIISMA